MSSKSPSNRSESDLEDYSNHKDLFHEQAPLQDDKTVKPWWKSHFFVLEPVLFGTWDGVFTSCLINIFGVVLFLRTGWMVGNVGIGLAMLIVITTVTVALLAVLSAIGLCERLRDMDTGGVYYIVSKVLGGKVGGTIGVMYAFGLSVVSALYCTGFAESVTQTFNWENEWAVRGVAIGTLLLLLAINLAGVKWVIRLQLLLLLVLLISTSDFIIGTFVHTEPESGFVGYSSEVMRNNSYLSLQPGETFFTVFGVFFPTATGVMAGVNMSGDLKNPSKSIPVGTLSALGISFFFYVVFVMLLGSTCLRDALQVDFMIAEKVSAVGVLWLLGVYMSSTSSCSTGLYGAPRVLQSIANENVIPAIKFLGKGFGANKTPMVAICVVGFISLVFIFIGNMNVISPIITCNFMLVYATVDYAYFALAMSYDLRIKNFNKFKTPKNVRKNGVKTDYVNYGTLQNEDTGTMDEFTKDLNNLFRHSNTWDTKTRKRSKKSSPNDKDKQKSGKDYLIESYGLDSESHQENGHLPQEYLAPTNIHQSEGDDATNIHQSEGDDETGVEPSEDGSVATLENSKETSSKAPSSVTADDVKLLDEILVQPLNDIDEIRQQPRSCYSRLCSRWSSLFGCFLCVIVMFLINWVYALANIAVFLLIFLYTSLFNPGLNPGVSAEFSFVEWIKDIFHNIICNCRKKESLPEQYVVTPVTGTTYTVVSTVLTKDNEDFANRGRFHQSAIGDYDYASLVAGKRSEYSLSDSSDN